MREGYSEWSETGATLSEASARKEFGLTQKDIIDAIKAGRLQYRQHNMYGHPYFRLLRREVEMLVRGKHGGAGIKAKQLKAQKGTSGLEKRTAG